MSSAGRIVVFGAGNIGRSFVGQLFAAADWEVVFVDVDPLLVAALNERHGYTVVVRREGQADGILEVRGVRAVSGRDVQAVAREIARADLAASCVGKAALPRILSTLAEGLRLRESGGGKPLDFILAENDREAVSTVKEGLSSLLGPDSTAFALLSPVETSIGKMVPLARPQDRERDPLAVAAEAYNTLIVDGKAFRNPIPAVPGLHPVDRIEAWVDRKLFVHNLGHAAVAYLGYRSDPGCTLVADALALPGVLEGAKAAMGQAAEALVVAYPAEFTRKDLDEHIEDLLARFANRALGDTIHRVGRDLPRKLDRSDRIVGAAILCASRSLPFEAIARIFAAALSFRAPGEDGSAYPADLGFLEGLAQGGLDWVLRSVCRLDPGSSVDAAVWAGLAAAVQG
jgi:mannitol-1-phosphate 5-dehydrogenase